MIRIRAYLESLRSNLFFIPAVLLAGSVVLSFATTWLDSSIQNAGSRLPAVLVSTVDSARALLGTVASAVVAFAGISISISLLLIQLASSQFSPRVLYGFFRDPFTKWVTGFVIATFAYCLLVLRVVRAPTETGALPVIPHLSVTIAIVLGIGAIVAVVALINHSARSMQVGEIIRRITGEARVQIRSLSQEREEGHQPHPSTPPPPAGPGFVVEAPLDGWLQLLDPHRILQAIPPGSTVRMDVPMGAFVPDRTPVCTIWPMPDDPEGVREHLLQGIHLGRSRTMQQDIAFGFRQLIDIALRALSPGINDPTTAQEALDHIGTLLRELLTRDLRPTTVEDDKGRRLLRPHERSHGDFVDLAFDQIRVAAATQPAVLIELLGVIALLISELRRLGLPERTQALRRQAQLILETARASQALPADVERVRRAAEPCLSPP